jgi:hypothetical protein
MMKNRRAKFFDRTSISAVKLGVFVSRLCDKYLIDLPKEKASFSKLQSLGLEKAL